ncbi:aminotransferase [Aliidongia dinghuensis]|uniref:Aminotransferase n=1 Tax=Aliidongia dinghuensis TaxID=1867774 RepID=A0A8J2YQD2_9PROT|nr:fatty acid desaturase [Aliidongia dinghuensis]GGF06363.1 aminotransferase [Aliidongia dinghuensis]
MSIFHLARRYVGRLATLRHWEWPTITVAAVLYAGFAFLTSNWGNLPLWVAAPLGAVLVAWHGSLQHETIHGHPTPFGRVNTLIGAPPLSLWLPYALYRETHLGHHKDHGRDLTDPIRDPESHYLHRGALGDAGRLQVALLRWHNTLGGRMLIGPALLVGRCWLTAVRRTRTDPHHRRLWLRHGLTVLPMLAWIVGVCRIPIAEYIGLVVYPSIALGLIRSFAEHRAAPAPIDRTAVVEAGWFWSLLFLNNNLHVVHHQQPSLPWYRIPDTWRRLRGQIGLAPGMLYERGYAEIFARHLLRPIGPAEHPGFEVLP